MKIEALNCPGCGTALGDDLKPERPFSCPACGSVLVLTNIATDDLIVCPGCQTVNADSSKFCTACGADIKTGCPFCCTPNPIDAEFCRTCGANLQRARQRKQNWLEEKRRHNAERQATLKAAEAWDRQARMQRLLHSLDEPENHPYAIYELHQFGTEAVGALVDLLKEDDPDARFGAAHALGLIGDPQTVPALIEALSDPEPAVRYWAADALGRLHAQEATPTLRQLLKDEHKGVKAHVADVLARIGAPRA